MTRRTKFWLAIAVLFIVVNVLGAGFAAVSGEWLHACAHTLAFLLGEYFVWRLARRQAAGY